MNSLIEVRSVFTAAGELPSVWYEATVSANGATREDEGKPVLQVVGSRKKRPEN